MRKSGVVVAILLASAAWSAVSVEALFAKEKSLPVPDWALLAAKTATPDSAKSAEAVVLTDEHLLTVDGQGRAVEREREARRILKPQGRSDWSYCFASYDVDEKINYLHAWTIQLDGRQMQAMEADFHEVGHLEDSILLETEKSRVVKAPGADVGSVVVCESEVQLRSYINEEVWPFQQSIPVLAQALELDLPSELHHIENWHHYDAVKGAEVGPNRWRWELNQVPPIDLREVPNAPDMVALSGRMSVRWGDGAVKGKDNQWRSIGQWVDQLEAHRPDPTPDISAKTHELTDGAAGYYAKLARVTDYIQRNIRYFVIERGIGGLQAHPAGDIFHHRYGDCKDKTTLLISMLQVAGIKAYYVPVDHRRGFVDPEVPSIAGDHMITAIEIPADVKDDRLMAVVKAANGKRYLIFDPTDERTPIGNLRTDLQGSYGLLVIGADSQIVELPVLPPGASGADRKGLFELAPDGALSGVVDMTRSGAEGGDLRLQLKFTDEKDVRQGLERSLGADIPGVSLAKYKYDEPQDLEKPVKLHYEVSTPQYGRIVGPLMLVRPRVVASYARGVDRKPRTVPIELGGTGHWHDSFDIRIPDGYQVDDLPAPVAMDTDFASYHSKVSVVDSGKGKALHYERSYDVMQVELPAAKAAEFRLLQGTISSDEKATAVLKKIEPAQGPAVASKGPESRQ